jgi:hypothetical protein
MGRGQGKPDAVAKPLPGNALLLCRALAQAEQLQSSLKSQL